MIIDNKQVVDFKKNTYDNEELWREISYKDKNEYTDKLLKTNLKEEDIGELEMKTMKELLKKYYENFNDINIDDLIECLFNDQNINILEKKLKSSFLFPSNKK